MADAEFVGHPASVSTRSSGVFARSLSTRQGAFGSSLVNIGGINQHSGLSNILQKSATGLALSSKSLQSSTSSFGSSSFGISPARGAISRDIEGEFNSANSTPAEMMIAITSGTNRQYLASDIQDSDEIGRDAIPSKISALEASADQLGFSTYRVSPVEAVAAELECRGNRYMEAQEEGNTLDGMPPPPPIPAHFARTRPPPRFPLDSPPAVTVGVRTPAPLIFASASSLPVREEQGSWHAVSALGLTGGGMSSRGSITAYHARAQAAAMDEDEVCMRESGTSSMPRPYGAAAHAPASTPSLFMPASAAFSGAGSVRVAGRKPLHSGISAGSAGSGVSGAGAGAVSSAAVSARMSALSARWAAEEAEESVDRGEGNVRGTGALAMPLFAPSPFLFTTASGGAICNNGNSTGRGSALGSGRGRGMTSGAGSVVSAAASARASAVAARWAADDACAELSTAQATVCSPVTMVPAGSSPAPFPAPCSTPAFDQAAQDRQISTLMQSSRAGAGVQGGGVGGGLVGLATHVRQFKPLTAKPLKAITALKRLSCNDPSSAHSDGVAPGGGMVDVGLGVGSGTVRRKVGFTPYTGISKGPLAMGALNTSPMSTIPMVPFADISGWAHSQDGYEAMHRTPVYSLLLGTTSAGGPLQVRSCIDPEAPVPASLHIRAVALPAAMNPPAHGTSAVLRGLSALLHVDASTSAYVLFDLQGRPCLHNCLCGTGAGVDMAVAEVLGPIAAAAVGCAAYPNPPTSANVHAVRGPLRARLLMLSRGCERGKADPTWVANAYRWVVAKLAMREKQGLALAVVRSTHINSPWDGYCCWERVLLLLLARYEREYGRTAAGAQEPSSSSSAGARLAPHRSALQYIHSGDVDARHQVVLTVAAVHTSGTDTVQHSASAGAACSVRLELSDGWYGIEALCSDAPFMRLAAAGKLKVGLKVRVCNGVFAQPSPAGAGAGAGAGVGVPGALGQGFAAGEPCGPLDTPINGVWPGRVLMHYRDAYGLDVRPAPSSFALMEGAEELEVGGMGHAAARRVLLMRYNSVRPASWTARLGHAPFSAFFVSLASLTVGGGPAPALFVVISRLHELRSLVQYPSGFKAVMTAGEASTAIAALTQARDAAAEAECERLKAVHEARMSECERRWGAREAAHAKVRGAGAGRGAAGTPGSSRRPSAAAALYSLYSPIGYSQSQSLSQCQSQSQGEDSGGVGGAFSSSSSSKKKRRKSHSHPSSHSRAKVAVSGLERERQDEEAGLEEVHRRDVEVAMDRFRGDRGGRGDRDKDGEESCAEGPNAEQYAFRVTPLLTAQVLDLCPLPFLRNKVKSSRVLTPSPLLSSTPLEGVHFACPQATTLTLWRTTGEESGLQEGRAYVLLGASVADRDRDKGGPALSAGRADGRPSPLFLPPSHTNSDRSRAVLPPAPIVMPLMNGPRLSNGKDTRLHRCSLVYRPLEAQADASALLRAMHSCPPPNPVHISSSSLRLSACGYTPRVRTQLAHAQTASQVSLLKAMWAQGLVQLAGPGAGAEEVKLEGEVPMGQKIVTERKAQECRGRGPVHSSSSSSSSSSTQVKHRNKRRKHGHDSTDTIDTVTQASTPALPEALTRAAELVAPFHTAAAGSTATLAVPVCERVSLDASLAHSLFASLWGWDSVPRAPLHSPPSSMAAAPALSLALPVHRTRTAATLDAALVLLGMGPCLLPDGSRPPAPEAHRQSGTGIGAPVGAILPECAYRWQLFGTDESGCLAVVSVSGPGTLRVSMEGAFHPASSRGGVAGPAMPASSRGRGGGQNQPPVLLLALTDVEYFSSSGSVAPLLGIGMKSSLPPITVPAGVRHLRWTDQSGLSVRVLHGADLTPSHSSELGQGAHASDHDAVTAGVALKVTLPTWLCACGPADGGKGMHALRPETSALRFVNACRDLLAVALQPADAAASAASADTSAVHPDPLILVVWPGTLHVAPTPVLHAHWSKCVAGLNAPSATARGLGLEESGPPAPPPSPVPAPEPDAPAVGTHPDRPCAHGGVESTPLGGIEDRARVTPMALALAHGSGGAFEACAPTAILLGSVIGPDRGVDRGRKRGRVSGHADGGGASCPPADTASSDFAHPLSSSMTAGRVMARKTASRLQADAERRHRAARVIGSDKHNAAPIVRSTSPASTFASVSAGANAVEASYTIGVGTTTSVGGRCMRNVPARLAALAERSQRAAAAVACSGEASAGHSSPGLVPNGLSAGRYGRQ